MSSIVARPTSGEELLYQKQPGFVSGITIGAAAPDGPAYTLDGSRTSLLASLDPKRLTILNFGSCT